MSTIRQVVASIGGSGPGRPHGDNAETLAAIEVHLRLLNWLAMLARTSIAGDSAARELLRNWLTSRRDPRDQSADEHEGQRAGEGVPGSTPGHGHPGRELSGPDGGGAGAFQNEHVFQDEHVAMERSLGVNVRAVREMFAGVTFATAGEPLVQQKGLELVQATVARTIDVLDVLYQHSLDAVWGLGEPQTVVELLGLLPRGDELGDLLLGRPGVVSKLPKLPRLNPLLGCLEELRHGAVGVGSAVDRYYEATADAQGLNARVVAARPSPVCTGALLTLEAGGQNGPFPVPRPEGYGVFFEPCGVAGEIVEWLPAHVTVRVPAAAGSGCVFFARAVDVETAQAMAAAESAAVARLGDCLGGLGIGRPFRGPVTFNLSTFCPRSLCTSGSPRHVEIQHPPEIRDLDFRDSARRVVGTSPVEAGTPLTLSWRIRSDAGGALQVELSGTKSVSALPDVGTIEFTTPDTCSDVSAVLTASNSCGTTTVRRDVTVVRRLRLSPDPVVVRTDSFVILTVHLSCAPAADVTVSLSASPSTPAPRVTVPPTVTVPAGQDRATVPVFPLTNAAAQASLEPELPAAEVTATATGHAAARVPVWVEPTGGQARVLPLAPEMVAVHVASLPSGKVLMFAASHEHFNDIDRLDMRVWDPRSGGLETPAFPYPTHKNLFCAGHCLLPDGRVLVVGGHAIFAGGSAAKQVHTFNPSTMSWARHAAMKKDRWYPTCVTLADGRALITSGSEAGGPPTIFKGVVRDVEVFDPATGGLTVWPDVHGDICMYPQMFVLPGNLLFFHSRNVSWLYRGPAGDWDPVSGTWSPDIPMQSSSTRSYPGMAACVLLPLLPEDGYRTRILMAGGGGAKECDLDRTTVATRSAEVLEVDTAGGTGTWRGVDASGQPLRTTRARFMTDAVLLPDGTVLLVNGAVSGVADHSHGAVSVSELFDPVHQTFRAMTATSVPRQYHGTAILLADGRVAIGGHTKEFNHPPVEENHFEIETISPPYLFRGPRPDITSVTPATNVGYGSPIDIVCGRATDIARVALVRPGSVTHQLNTDQRYVGLSFSHLGGGRLRAVAPPDGFVAPPGYYLLFLVDDRGVPSRGSSLRIGR